MSNAKSGSRLKEITAVLRKHEITKGMTPVKLRLILEDLGPTFIKIGQIMSLHSDVLPKKYCDELMKLRSDVPPMPFSEVEEVIEESYGCPWKEVFSDIEKTTLGSASIAQVHRATLKSGEKVVIKVQRKGIYDTMARDIGLLHKAVKLVPPISIKETVDFSMVLDELWVVTQEEMNFLTEAANMEEFARRNKDIAFVRTPILYKEHTTHHVLVMEYIDGYPIDDKVSLQENGYDLHEIGTKLIDNYIKQVMEDGFFHADPHPGNVCVSDGKIVWIDMGMMGRLSERDRELIGDAIQGIAINDIGMIQDAVLALGEFRGKPDQSKLYEDISTLMMKYGKLDMGNIDVAETMQDAIDAANEIASEHLEIVTANPFEVMTRIRNAGAIFIGEYSSEPLGDYFAGPNHVLPTNGTSRFFSPLNVDDFVKKSSIVYYSREALEAVHEDIEKFAKAEQLTAHANSIHVRFE